MKSPETWLRERKLLKGRGKGELLRWCHVGRLSGGFSVSLRATPDEALGPLTHAMGGAARSLKVLDVRVRPGEPMELEVRYPAPEDSDEPGAPAGSKKERWAVADVPGLAHNLNDLYRGDAEVGAVAMLGEYDDMWQLWVVTKLMLKELLAQRWFAPRNASDLEAALQPRADAASGSGR